MPKRIALTSGCYINREDCLMGLNKLKKGTSVQRDINWILDKTIADHMIQLIHYCGGQQVLVSIGQTRIGDLCITFTGRDIEKTTEYFQDKETLVLRIKEIVSD